MNNENTQANPSYSGDRPDIVELVPVKATNLLDVGCSVGALGASLKSRNPDASVTGVELDQSMAELAEAQLDRVIVADLDQKELSRLLDGERFDCIIFADVLEHVKKPWDTLGDAKALLAEDGIVVASIPNVCHISTIISLLFKRTWPRRERGIHDKTHLRFFCRKDIEAMFEQEGFLIQEIKAIYRIIERPHRYNRFSKYFAIPGLRDLFTFQLLIVAEQNGAAPG